MFQLELFPKSGKIKSVELLALSSPRKAFYTLWLEEHSGKYLVLKESGSCMSKTRNRLSWAFPTIEAAEEYYERKIKAKTNPVRKSPRKYKIIRSD